MVQPLKSSVPQAGSSALAPDTGAWQRPRASQLWIATHLAVEEWAPAPPVLESMAAWALRFTPTVSLEPPDGLLLEVAGSLRLFGGLGAIKKALAKELRRRRIAVHVCAAPTPLAALWLARCRREDVLSAQSLAGRLSPLPMGVTRWPVDVQALLRDMGVRTLGDCLRLPRGGFARRLGREYMVELDEALGRRWARRVLLEPPRRLSARAELGDETTECALLTAVGKQLIERLAAELRRRQAQIQSLELAFHHRRGSPTTETLRLVEPAHEVERFAALLEDKLERIALPAPVLAVGLSTGSLLPMRLAKASLFDDIAGPAERNAVSVLIEKLQGRFGAERVHGLEPSADHRPERAWRKVTRGLLERKAASATVSPWASQRPSWLLPVPLPLGEALDGTLSAVPRPFDACDPPGGGEPPRDSCSVLVECGPERIETGWWDGQDVTRDYYTITTPRGERLWVYRQRTQPRMWYLHGIFG